MPLRSNDLKLVGWLFVWRVWFWWSCRSVILPAQDNLIWNSRTFFILAGWIIFTWQICTEPENGYSAGRRSKKNRNFFSILKQYLMCQIGCHHRNDLVTCTFSLHRCEMWRYCKMILRMPPKKSYFETPHAFVDDSMWIQL